MTVATDHAPAGVCRPELSLEDLKETPVPSSIDAGGATPSQPTPGQLRPPAIATPRRDPRDEPLAVKDVVGLTTLGLLGCMTGPQIRFECYGGCRESNFARRLDRWQARGWVGVTRFLGMGANIIWLTPKGAGALVDGGHAADEHLFPRERAVAAKDLAHHLWIVDLTLLALRGVPAAYERVEPAWLIQRERQPEAVPDVALSSPLKTPGQRKVLAYEVDLASESTTVFVPKLERLSRVLTTWANGGTAAVVILTRGSGRASSLERAVRARGAAIQVPVVVKLLPTGGSACREALAEVVGRGGKSAEGVPPATGKVSP